jgi:hypothetical protein
MPHTFVSRKAVYGSLTGAFSGNLTYEKLRTCSCGHEQQNATTSHRMTDLKKNWQALNPDKTTTVFDP